MDNNFIKDNRVFPEEMHTGASLASSASGAENKNHTVSVLWWILGLLVLLAIVFLTGLWTGKKTSEVIQQRTDDAENIVQQEIRQEAINQQAAYRVNMSSEDRTERLRNFFGE